MADFEALPAILNQVSGTVVEAAFQVHEQLGPGLLESVYELCLAEELNSRGCSVERQVRLPIRYKDKLLDAQLRLDLMVNNCVIVEVKAVDSLLPLHEAQLLTYLKLTGVRLGLLLNFNVPLIRSGIRRLIR